VAINRLIAHDLEIWPASNKSTGRETESYSSYMYPCLPPSRDVAEDITVDPE
jgi:hypothetical protein